MRHILEIGDYIDTSTYSGFMVEVVTHRGLEGALTLLIHNTDGIILENQRENYYKDSHSWGCCSRVIKSSNLEAVGNLIYRIQEDL